MKTLQLCRLRRATDVVRSRRDAPWEPGPGQLAVAIEAARSTRRSEADQGIYGVRRSCLGAGRGGVGRVVAVGRGRHAPYRERVLVFADAQPTTWPRIDPRRASTPSPSTRRHPLQLRALHHPSTAHSFCNGYVTRARCVGWRRPCELGDAPMSFALARHAVPAPSSMSCDAQTPDVTCLDGPGARYRLSRATISPTRRAYAIGDAPLRAVIDGVAGEPVRISAPRLKTGRRSQLHPARAGSPSNAITRSLHLSAAGATLRANALAADTPRENGRRDPNRELRRLVARRPRAAPVEHLTALRSPRGPLRPCRPPDRKPARCLLS